MRIEEPSLQRKESLCLILGNVIRKVIRILVVIIETIAHINCLQNFICFSAVIVYAIC